MTNKFRMYPYLNINTQNRTDHLDRITSNLPIFVAYFPTVYA